MMNEQIEKLKKALPYMIYAFNESKKDGTPEIYIGTRYADGGGKINCSIPDSEEFLTDLCAVVGIPFTLTKEQELECKALDFLFRFGIKK